MNRNKIHLIFAFIMAFTFVTTQASSISYYNESEVDLNIRVNPTIEHESIDHPLINEYSYLNLNNNNITYNNANYWQGFYNKLKNTSIEQVSIVHIGDSHLQADIATRRTRALFHEQFGDAGRGLIAPLKIAKTNEPIDYYFKCNSPYVSASLMRRPWKSNIRLTGVSFSPKNENYNIAIGTVTNQNINSTFSRIRIHVDGDLYIDSVMADNISVDYKIYENSQSFTDIIFSRPVSNVELWLSSIGRLSILGASLLKEDSGVIYNVIGNNGASFMSYNKMGQLGEDCTNLNPDLFIISLGANEAFGNLTNDGFYNSIKTFVDDLIISNPNIPILLVTPMECQRKGQINHKIKQFRDVILQFGVENNIAVYDWYNVAGGYNASSHWVKDGLMSKDRIHNTNKGYSIQGTLLYEVLTRDL